MYRRFGSSQSGVALVMAMMIVALITIIAVEISWRFELSVSRSANRWAGVQAKAYLEGAEQLAMVALREDVLNEKTNETDTLSEFWAEESPPFPTDHGYVRGRIEDAHGRFNINMLARKPGTCQNGEPPKKNGVCQQGGQVCENFMPAAMLFMRMLQTFNLGTKEEPEYLPFDLARGITEAVMDWLDRDSQLTGFGGAESDYYEGLEVPVSISNGEMTSVSELQVIKGMLPALYQQLLPYVIALPQKEVSTININTTNFHVLRSLRAQRLCILEPHDVDDAQELADFIRDEDFKKMDDFLNGVKDTLGGPFGDFESALIDKELISIGQSTYFLFFGEAGVGDGHVRRGATLLRRDNGGNVPGQSGQPAAPRPPGEINIEVVRRTDANF